MQTHINQESITGIVVIGRNEGERLRACFESLKNNQLPIVYVDSGSTDDSTSLAKSYCKDIINLDMSQPFSAARARNAGYQRLLEMYPKLSFIQFIDGDCELEKNWITAAQKAFDVDLSLAAVIGHLQEKYANETVYNKLCALEWRSPAGKVSNYGGFGGIAMLRSSALVNVGGYNPNVIAGEDSELGVRLSLNGYFVRKIDVKMATHDANITSFKQWWRRSIRAGHAIGQRAHINGETLARDNVKERKSTLFWGLILPIIIISLLYQSYGLSLVLSGGYLLIGYRSFRFRKRIGDSTSEAFLYARYNLLAKFANIIGLIKFYLNRKSGNYEIIEYKES